MQNFRTEDDGTIPNWPLVGVVSLLDMLRFAADRFYRLSEEMTRMSADVDSRTPVIVSGEGSKFRDIEEVLTQLGLVSSLDQVARIMNESQAGRLDSGEKFSDLLTDLHRRIHDDLARKVMYSVESDRSIFCDVSWLSASVIATKFPTAFRELQAAGRNYAYGESAASAFHSMRALEVGLGVLATRFNIDFQHTNWHPVIEGIESAIRDISKAPKSQQRLDDEKFFGGLGRHFMFLKNGWRNHVMHVRENYTDREARQMLDHVTDLLTDMSAQLAE